MSSSTQGADLETPGEVQPFGRDTVMEPALAVEHGVSYVHLACMAIDLDRIREAVEPEPESIWPFGWEVFLLEIWLVSSLDMDDEDDRALVRAACSNVLALPPGCVPLGSQIPFAVYDAIHRGEWPTSLGGLFASWKGRGASVVETLAPLWAEPEVEAADLALACLEHPLEPPMAAPTRHALEAMVEALVSDAADSSHGGGSGDRGDPARIGTPAAQTAPQADSGRERRRLPVVSDPGPERTKA